MPTRAGRNWKTSSAAWNRILLVLVVIIIVIGAGRLTGKLRRLTVDAVSEDPAWSESQHLAGRDHHGLTCLRVAAHTGLLGADAEFAEARNLDHSAFAEFFLYSLEHELHEVGGFLL